MSVLALVPATGSVDPGGRAEDSGSGLSDVLRPLGGVPLLVRTVRGLLDSDVVDEVLVVVPAADLDTVRTLFGAVLGRPGGREPAVEVIGGAADRISALSAALRLGLERRPDTRIVLVHDAARALTPPSLVRAMVEAVGDGTGCKAVVPVLPVADTVKRAAGSENRVLGTVDRSSLRTAQTPAAFHRELLERALAAAATEPVSTRRGEVWLVERLGEKVRAVPGDPLAFHIGTTWDLRIASLLADA